MSTVTTVARPRDASREEPDFGALGDAMYELATELFPLTRSLTGPGYRRTLELLEEVSGPADCHRFASGERVFDWTIPPEWTLRDAWIDGPGGERVISLADSNLHVVAYSVPVRARMTLEELQPQLHSLPGQPHAIPYRTSYYRRHWGFCLTDAQRRELPSGEYEVMIDAELAPGHVELSEVVIPGTTADEVLFSTYCCHPSMANNELSGPVLVAHLAALLRRRASPPRFTYRFLFAPETIGAIAYLSRFGERLRHRLAAGYVVTCAGDPGAFAYKRSRRGDTLADRVAEHCLEYSGREWRALDFFATGSDERQYCSPGFDLPVGSLMRSMYGTYPEYHTSLDDLSLIRPRALGESLEVYWRIVEALEANETFEATMPWCEPNLGSRGLYPTTGGAGLREDRLHDMMHVLNFCDGGRDLLAVAERGGRPIEALVPVVRMLCDHGLLRRRGGGDAERLQQK
jgi:aminopeptidase-like protein